MPGLLLFTQMGADTSKVSADSTFPHAAAGRIPGQSGSQRRGMREGWVRDAILPCPLSSGSWHHGITSGCPPGLLRARAGTEPGGKAQTGTRGWESASHPEAGFSLPSRDLPPMRASSERELEERLRPTLARTPSQPSADAFGFRREHHRASRNKCQEIKKGLQGWSWRAALTLSFRLRSPHLGSQGCSDLCRGIWHLRVPQAAGEGWLRPLLLGAGPQRPLYAQPQRLQEGASSPSLAAAGNAEPGGQGPAAAPPVGPAARRRGLHHTAVDGGVEREPGFSCLCD